MQGLIDVRDLGKKFRRHDKGRPSTLKGLVLSGRKGGGRSEFWGLRHVSFHIPPGRAVGVVGRNGAGKSTLLRILGGVILPDEGSVAIRGRIGALLEIGAGLTDDLSGRENIFLMGVVAGMMRAEVAARFDEIVAFAELADFIDRPVRTYSTGMKMRLSFSVAVHVEPEILLIDEVLAVGDLAFQAKCLARVEAIKARGCTIFLVSHDSGQVRALCDDALFLKDGSVVAHGPVEETLALFESSMESAQPADDAHALPQSVGTLRRNVNRWGSQAAEIGEVALLGANGRPVDAIVTGGALTVQFRCRSDVARDDLLALAAIYDAEGNCCSEINTLEAGHALSVGPEPRTVALRMERLDLAEGQYRVTVGLFSADWHHVFDYHAEIYPLKVNGPRMSKGFLRPPASWTIERS